MNPIQFPEINHPGMKKPKGWTDEECTTLPVWVGPAMVGQRMTPSIVSAWRMTADELKEFLNTGIVYLRICGEGMPPVSLFTHNPWRWKEGYETPRGEVSGAMEILEERFEQIEKHGYTTEYDINNNGHFQLIEMAHALINPYTPDVDEIIDKMPDGLHPGMTIEQWCRIMQKSFQERLRIAGALIAAQIDREKALEKQAKTFKPQ